ncbi:hypothetical protein ACJX0J_038650 [Zea mays]
MQINSFRMEDRKLIWDTLEKHLPTDLPKNIIKRKNKAIWHLWHNLYFRKMGHNKIDFNNYSLDTHAGGFAGTVNKPVYLKYGKEVPLGATKPTLHVIVPRITTGKFNNERNKTMEDPQYNRVYTDSMTQGKKFFIKLSF